MGKSLKEYGDMMKNNRQEDEAKAKSAADAFGDGEYEEPELTADDDIQLSEIPISPMILEKELKRGHLIAMRAQEEFIYVVEDKENERYHLFTHTFGEEAAGRRDCKNDENSLEMIKQMLRVADAAYSCIYYKDLQLPSVMAAMEQGIVSRFPEVEKRVAKKPEEGEEASAGKDEDKQA